MILVNTKEVGVVWRHSKLVGPLYDPNFGGAHVATVFPVFCMKWYGFEVEEAIFIESYE